MKSSHRLVNRSHATRGAAILAIAASAAITQSASAQYRIFWIGGLTGNSGGLSTPVVDPTHIDDNFANPNNWQNNSPPEANDPGQIEQVGNGSPSDGFNHTPAQATFDASTMTRLSIAPGGSVVVGSVVVSDAAGNFGTLVMNGGTLTSNIQFGIGGWVNNAAATGTLQMNGGQININAGSMTIGYSNSNTALTGNSNGNVVMMGGTINFNGQGLYVGSHTSLGTFNQSGGVVSGTGTLGLGVFGTAANTTAGAGTYLLSGTGQVAAGTVQFGSNVTTRVPATSGDAFIMTGGELSATNVVVGNLTASPGFTSFTFSGGTLTAGTFRLALTQSGGTLSPGAGGTIGGGTQISTMHLLDNFSGEGSNSHPSAGQGNYTQGAAGHLLIDIGTGNSDPTVSTNDRLQVEDNANGDHTTSATLNGEIDLRVNNTYSSPVIGDTFNIVTADAITDTSTLKVTHESPNYIFTKAAPVSGSVATGFAGSPTTSGQILQVAFAGHARPGDDTRDKTIDSSDFSMLAAHFGQSTTSSYTIGWGDGDFNGDGIVNALDFNALATNYGKGGTVESPIGGAIADGETAASLGSVVPEPMSAMILLGAMGISLLGRKRRSI